MDLRRLPLTLLVVALSAQEAPPPAQPGIQDNSFLIEEAYNQEAGVVQHIGTFMRLRESGDWVATFTQEWPVGGLAHQLSYTLPYQRLDASPDGRRGAGDVALNYRYQLLGDGDARVAFAPRVSLLLPTGAWEQGCGAGAAGYQVNLPLSVVLGPRVVTHLNLGATWTPRARSAAGDRADLRATNLGQSLIWLARPDFNVMLELAYTKAQTISGPGTTSASDSFYVSPGVRWAHNFPSGLQIVPGVALPIGVGPSRGDRAIFLYLSFEHPFGGG
ncbi:MAG TPA: hypothetical protein VJ483_08580, partial [Holophagaceae bacterium]|nr:hypothetical protein [Holophagaceae bacterium]